MLGVAAIPYLICGGLLLGIVGFGGGCHVQAVRDAKKIGGLEGDVKAKEAVLTDVQAQRDKLQGEVAKATPAADRVITVTLPERMRETNSIQIGTGCAAAVAFTRIRLPVLVAHRKVEATP